VFSSARCGWEGPGEKLGGSRREIGLRCCGRCQSLMLVRMAECMVPVRFRYCGGEYLPLRL